MSVSELDEQKIEVRQDAETLCVQKLTSIRSEHLLEPCG